MAAIQLMNIVKKYWKILPNVYSLPLKEKQYFKENIFILFEKSYSQPKIHKILEKTIKEIFENESFEEFKVWIQHIILRISNISTNEALFSVLVMLKSMVFSFILLNSPVLIIFLAQNL